MSISPSAGKPAQASMLVDIPKLISAYFVEQPDAKERDQRVSFGTSGHRGSSLARSFNEAHILAITQAICLHRIQEDIHGPLFIGFDSHALSRPAFITAVEVLAANGIDVMISDRDEYTPTPAISHAILAYNQGRTDGWADGIVITPSHNPPDDGGFKYNPPNGGPAGSGITKWVQDKANEFLENGLAGVRRMSFRKALAVSTTHTYDYADAYVSDLGNVLDMEAIRGAGLKLGVDPLGGAGVDYWEPIADRYKIDLTVVNKDVDYTFRFMSLDWDGRIRMDPSSTYAMQSLIGLKDQFDVAFACDTDHDRHGIVTRSSGLMQPNHYLSVCVDYLFSNRAGWPADAAVGKTVVSSSMIDRVTAALGRRLYEVPVGFKWFVDGLVNGWLGFGGEESAGASFLRRDGKVWSTDKDGMIAALLSAEITARVGRDPGEVYRTLTERFGAPAYERTDARATVEQKARLQKLSPQDVQSKELAGEPIKQVMTDAPDGNAIGGVKVISENAWFAARPSGTEEIYKIYAESFRGTEHLKQVQVEAQQIVATALASGG